MTAQSPKPREFFINQYKLNDAIGLHFVAKAHEMREFKGIHVREVLSEANEIAKDEVRVSREDWDKMIYFMLSDQKQKLSAFIERIEKEQGPK